MRGSLRKVVLVLALMLLAALAPLQGPDATTGEGSSSLIPPIAFTEASDGLPGVTYEAHIAGSADVASMMSAMGVREDGKSYNTLYDGLGTGLAPPTMEQYGAMAGSMRVFDSVSMGQGVTLPTTVDHSKEKQFPTVDSQGGQGSCAAWATSYYTNGYLQAKDMGWNDTAAGNKSHLMSPAWVYNKINGGYDGGSNWWDNTALMMDLGNAVWASQVYNAGDLYGWGNESAWRSAPQYRINERLDFGDPADTALIKAWVAEGYVCPIALKAGNYNYIGVDGILTAAEHQGGYADHANTIVGYNDSIVAGNDVGAFRVVNSWGKGWGWGGYYWMTYDAVAELDWYVLRIHDLVDYQPQLLATFNQSTTASKESRLYVGTTSGLYSNFEPYKDGGSATKMPAFMCIDASSLAEDLGLAKFAFYLGSGTTVGTVSAYALEWYQSGYAPGKPTMRAVSTDTPKRAPATMYASFEGVHIAIASPDAGSWHRGNVTFAGTATAAIAHQVLKEDFEGPWASIWTKEDKVSASGADFWGWSTERVHAGMKSVWCAASDGGVVYSEDFNHGGSLPGGWKASSDGPSTYPFTSVNAGYRGCGGTDYLVVADSNRGAGTNVTERLYMSTPFNASDFTGLQLRLYLDYDNYGGDEYAEVLVANSTTYPVFATLSKFTADAFGIRSIDLSSQDGEAEVYLGLRYHGTVDRYMAVDDVTVLGARAEYDDDMQADLYRTISVGAYDNVTLDYDYWIESEDGVDTLSAMYRTSTAAPWVLLTNHSGDDGGWNHVTVEVPTNATHIGLRFASNASVTYEGAYLDDVAVTGLTALDGIDIRVDDGSWTRAATGANWTAEWNSTGSTDGAHNISFRSVYGSEWDLDSVPVRTDNTPPQAASVSNTDPTTGDPAELGVRATDLNAMALPVLHYTFAGHQTLQANCTELGAGAWNLTITVPSDATSLEYRFWLEDVLGNGVFTETRTVPVVDNDAPLLGDDMTPAEATTGDAFEFAMTVADNIAVSTTHVEYWYGDAGVPENLSVDGGALSIVIGVLDTLEPIHFFFSSVDTSGNWVRGAERTVPVRDNDAPEFGEDRTPATGTTGETVTMSIDVGDNIAVGTVGASYWFGEGEAVGTSMERLSPTSFWCTISIPVDSLAPLHYIFRAGDSSDNWNQTQIGTVIVLDNDLPWFLSDATPETATTGDPLTFSVDVIDNIGVGSVWVEYWYDAGPHQDLAATGEDGGVWTLTLTVADTLLPIHYIVHMNDTSGNLNLTLMREVQVLDNDAPVFVADSSPEWVPTGTAYTFRVEVRDNIGIGSVLVWYRFDDLPVTSQLMTGDVLTGRWNGTYVFTVVTPADSTAYLKYYFESSDLVENWARTGERLVEVRDITPPTAVAGADIELDQHQVAHFDGRGSSDNVEVAAWTWEIDSGSNVLLYGTSPTFQFDDAGTYIVTLTVRDPSGNSAMDTITLVVRDITPPVADAGHDSVIDQGQTATFAGERCTDNVGVVTWEWTFEYGGAPVSLSGPNESYTFGAPGTYLITLRATDAAGNSASATTHLKVTDIVPPTATLHMVLDAKKGVPVTLDGSGSTDNVGIVNWTWRIRLEGESTWREVYGETPRFTFQKPGDHSVQLVVTDADGNTATSERVTVHVPNTMLWIAIIVVVAAAVVLLVAAAARRRRRE